eukprot:760167-Hanusia_phi.AAC.6
MESSCLKEGIRYGNAARQSKYGVSIEQQRQDKQDFHLRRVRKAGGREGCGDIRTFSRLEDVSSESLICTSTTCQSTVVSHPSLPAHRFHPVRSSGVDEEGIGAECDLNLRQTSQLPSKQPSRQGQSRQKQCTRVDQMRKQHSTAINFICAS